jgi:hypothetical protein
MKKILSTLLILTMFISFGLAAPQTFTYIKPANDNGILVRDAGGKQHILIPSNTNKIGNFKQNTAYEYYYTDNNYYNLQIRDSYGVLYEYIDTIQQQQVQTQQAKQSANDMADACLIATGISLAVILIVGLVAIAGS